MYYEIHGTGNCWSCSIAPIAPVLHANDSARLRSPARGGSRLGARRQLSIVQEAFGDSVEEAAAGDDPGHATVVDDGDDEYTVVQERFGDLCV